MLFFTVPGNKRVTQKETKASSRAAVNRIPDLINIRINIEVKGGVTRKVKTMKHNTLDIAENVNYCNIVCRMGATKN